MSIRLRQRNMSRENALRDGAPAKALNEAEGVALTADMSRQFDAKTVDHVFEEVLPKALESKEVDVAVAAERVLAKHGLSKPNHVSGLWGPLEIPRNELQVRELFASRLPEYGYRLVASSTEFPDWLLLNDDDEFVYTEVEHRSSNFDLHEHDAKVCDLIACWEHDWPDCPLPVLEFFSGEISRPEASPSQDDPERVEAVKRAFPVNFSAALAAYSTPDLGRAQRLLRKDYVLKRHSELQAGGLSEPDAVSTIAAEANLRRQAVRSILRKYGSSGYPRSNSTPARGRGLRADQYAASIERLMLEGMSKSEAVYATAEEAHVAPNTVWSSLSRRKKKLQG